MLVIPIKTLNSRLYVKTLRASYVVRQPGKLPRYTGSMIRGIFGRALKKIFCTVPHGDCVNCRYYDSCHYVDFFEKEESGEMNGISKLPRPYVIRNLPQGRDYSVGEIIHFDLVLFGRAAEMSLYFEKTMELMALFPWMSSAVWLDFHSVDTRIEPSLGHPSAHSWDETRSIQEFLNDLEFSDQEETFRIRFISPVRIKHKNSELRKMNPIAFSFHLIQRYKLLNSLYGSFCPEDIESVGFLELEKIRETYLAQERYSYRQQKRHILPGIMGEYNLHIKDPILKKLLVFGYLTNIGKNTTFGYGNFEILEGLRYGT